VARDYCESLGGHLARIESRKELEFVIALVKSGELTDTLWIDGSDEISENDWRFSNGRPMSFAAWQSQEPNNLDSEHHVSLHHFTFYYQDTKSSKRKAFIIEWDK
jgi:hypothetical protein